MKSSFWMVSFPWLCVLLLALFIVVDKCIEKRAHMSILESYTASHPELGKYYKVLEPITPEMLKFMLVVDKDACERETMNLRSALKAGRSGDLTNMFFRLEKRIKENEKGMKKREEAIRDPFGSYLVPRTKDKDIVCCFWFVHPHCHDFGFLVARNGKIVYREPLNGVYFSDELDEIRFEGEINELEENRGKVSRNGTE